MDFRIEKIEEMFIAGANAPSRTEALTMLNDHLAKLNESAQRYFYIEMTSNGKVLGSMAMAKVSRKLEGTKKIHTNTTKAQLYLIFDLTYQTYLDDSVGKSKLGPQIEDYIKTQGYKTAGFPMFESLSDSSPEMIRVSIPLK